MGSILLGWTYVFMGFGTAVGVWTAQVRAGCGDVRNIDMFVTALAWPFVLPVEIVSPGAFNFCLAMAGP